MSDLLVKSSVRYRGKLAIAGRLNLMGRWVKARSADFSELAGLEKLKLTSPNLLPADDVLERLLLSSHLRGLREVEGLPRWFLPRVARARPAFALERVSTFEGGDEAKLQPQLEKALAKPGALPRLTDLRLSWADTSPRAYRWLFETEVGSRLKVLRLNCNYFGKALGQWRAALEKAPGLALEELELFHGWTISLHRGESGWSTLTGDLTADRYGLAKRELDEVASAFDVSAVER